MNIMVCHLNTFSWIVLKHSHIIIIENAIIYWEKKVKNELIEME